MGRSAVGTRFPAGFVFESACKQGSLAMLKSSGDSAGGPASDAGRRARWWKVKKRPFSGASGIRYAGYQATENLQHAEEYNQQDVASTG